MAEHRQLAENALKSLCGRIGVEYGWENDYREGAWFLSTINRNKVEIAQWSQGSRSGGRSIHFPLGNYGQNLTHEQVYDRCWFADRVLTAAGARYRKVP